MILENGKDLMKDMFKGTIQEFYGFKVFKNLNLNEDEYKFEKNNLYVGLNIYKWIKNLPLANEL